MENFIYLITDVDSRQAAVVDPAWEPDKIIEYASANDIQITDILLTHSHHDHINGVEEVLNKYDSKLHLLKAEADFWQADLVKPELHYGGDTISIGQSSIQVLHTPGHTPGSTCYMLDGDLITGDTLFVFGCGRCDLQGGDPEQMFTTLKKIIGELESDARGPYAGAIGYFSFSGNMDTAIAIRTSVIKDGIAYLQAGGGVVYDSDPEAEYQESLQKASALLRAIDEAEKELEQ